MVCPPILSGIWCTGSQCSSVLVSRSKRCSSMRPCSEQPNQMQLMSRHWELLSFLPQQDACAKVVAGSPLKQA